MTTQINKEDRFLGHPVTKLKAFLTSWEKGTRDPDDLAKLSAVKLTPGAATAFLGECFDRGFFVYPSENDGNAWPELSLAGEAVVAASARKRTKKEAANKVLQDVLDNAQRLNQDPNAVATVTRIWVFGSMIDPEKSDVGDIDLVIEWDRRPISARIDLNEIRDHIEKHYPGTLTSGTQFYAVEQVWLDKMLYGTRRHPLLAVNDLTTLKDLHRPCSLFFDDQKGGIIRPQNFAYHPDSQGRADRIKDRLEMPDFSPSREFSFIPADVLKSAHRDIDTPIITSDTAVPKNIAKLLKGIDINGRSDFAILLTHNDEAQALLHVERSIHFGSTQWDYDMKVRCLYQKPKASFPSYGAHVEAEIISNLYNGDGVRLANLRGTLSGYETINTAIEFCPKSLAIPELASEFERRTTRWFYEEDRSHFPDGQNFSFDLATSNDAIGFLPLMHFGEQEWSEETQVTKEKYHAWLSDTDPELLAEIIAGDHEVELYSGP